MVLPKTFASCKVSNPFLYAVVLVFCSCSSTTLFLLVDFEGICVNNTMSEMDEERTERQQSIDNMAHCLMWVNNYHHYLARFRCSAHKLQVQVGRYVTIGLLKNIQTWSKLRLKLQSIRKYMHYCKTTEKHFKNMKIFIEVQFRKTDNQRLKYKTLIYWCSQDKAIVSCAAKYICF